MSPSLGAQRVEQAGAGRLEAGGWRSRPNTHEHQPQAGWFNVAVPAGERSAPWQFRPPFLTAPDRHRRKGSQDDPQARVDTRPRVRNRAQCRETASSQPHFAERILLRCSTPWKRPLAGLATSIRISLRAGMSDYAGRPPRQGCRPTRTPEACCDRAFAISCSPYSLQPTASSLSAWKARKAPTGVVGKVATNVARVASPFDYSRPGAGHVRPHGRARARRPPTKFAPCSPRRRSCQPFDIPAHSPWPTLLTPA